MDVEKGQCLTRSLQATAAGAVVVDGAGDLLLPGFVVAQHSAAVPELWRCSKMEAFLDGFGLDV